MAGEAAGPDQDAARALLTQCWQDVLDETPVAPSPEVARLLESGGLSMRYCLLTQTLGKATDSSLDILCLQKEGGGTGQWDPRSFCQRVVVPWVAEQQGVLGDSPDPYVNNPLRRPSLTTPKSLQAAADWQALTALLADAQDNGRVPALLADILRAIRQRMERMSFSYPVPRRVSAAQVVALVSGFLSAKSGGDRGLAVTAALFSVIGQTFGLYDEIRRGRINAADRASGSAGDIECVKAGHIRLVVEVKERRFGEQDVRIALDKTRRLHIDELLMCTHGPLAVEAGGIAGVVSAAWASGTNIHDATLQDLLRGLLPLLGEVGIRAFVTAIGQQLDAYGSDARHKTTWKRALQDLA